MSDFTKDPLFEEARIWAEAQMPEGWDRKDRHYIASFYQHFASFIYDKLVPYKKIAESVSSIFFYGNFKVETPAEADLEKQLMAVNLWPTTEDDILKRKEHD